MTPVPPPDSSNYPRSEHEQVQKWPFKGDRTYIAVDILLTIIGFVFSFSAVPALTEQSMKQQAAGGPEIKYETMLIVNYGLIGCFAIVCIPIGIFLWLNILKGRTWAFIVSLVFAILGMLSGIYGVVAGVMFVSSLFSLVAGSIRTVYLGMRVGGKIGPKTI